MVRNGKVGLPVEDNQFQQTWGFFKGCDILKKGLLDVASMPAAKDLVIVEDVSEEALPATSTLTHGASGSSSPAEKAAQKGRADWP